ncbi:MAG: heavy metal-binding domain-containing protein [Candidatus Thalassarchaeum sp.]|nr:heavy metal-binding domain-containing protein [Candidatus Thalassarchaeum sp.]
MFEGWGVLGIAGGVLLAPLLLLALIGMLWAIAYPLMLLWAVLFSGKKLDQQIVNTASREASLRESLGRDPLTTIDGGYRTDITSCGVVWAGVVYGPSHWHLLIGWINNLVGGSVDIFQKVISAGRAEAMQRLRESAVANGWDDVINVRIDTSDMAPQGAQRSIKAVEVFAYGTGVKYG